MMTATSCEEMRKVMQEFFSSAPHGEREKLWDILTCLRGPDSPSEAPNQSQAEQSENYAGRRARKYDTVEVIREKAFFGTIGGSARHRGGNEVVLPPEREWDHFDKHVARAAKALGIEVRVRETEQEKGTKVELVKSKKPVAGKGIK